MDFKKITAYFLVIIFAFTQSGFAAPKRNFIMFSFEKGLNTQMSPWLLKDNQATKAQNIRFNKTYGSIANRNVMLEYGDAGASAITGMHRYYKADATKKLVVTLGTDMKVGNDNTGAFQVMAESLTDGKWWQFVTYMDIAIGVNGYDNNKKYDGKTLITANTDGARTASNLVADLGAPFAELNTGTDLEASKWYQYKVAYYDGSLYEYSTAKSNPILTGTTVHNISLTGVPKGITGTTARYVYRTLGNSSKTNVLADTDYYLVGTIGDNTTTTFNDDVTDATAGGDSPPTWTTASGGTNVTPPTGKYCLIHDERLFVAGNTSALSNLYWSAGYNPDVFDIVSYEPIREDDGDSITFLRSLLGQLIVGKENTIQPFYTNTGTYYASDPLSFTGCPAPYSVANTPFGLMYLSYKGLYSFNGQGSKLVSDDVTPEIEDILTSNFGEAVGYYWKNEYQLAYTSSRSGAQANNRVLVYDIVRDAYSLDYKKINCFYAFSSGTDTGVLYSGSSGTDATVYAHQGSSNILAVRYKSDFNSGTFDDARVYGEEEAPVMEIAWDCTIDGWLTELQTKDANINTIDDIGTYLADAIIDRPDTTGTWVSPVYEVNASKFDELFWNESLGTTGNVTIQLKTGADPASMGTYGTAYSNPNGADISGETANTYVQFRINLTTTNINYSPELSVVDGFLLKITYLKEGSTYESDFSSQWESGWKDFKASGYPKRLSRIKTYYTGDSGELTLSYENAKGDISKSFDIDLSQPPPFKEDPFGNYYDGTVDNKIYTFYPALNAEGDDPVGQWWQFGLSRVDGDDFTVDRIEVIYELEEYED